MSARSIDDADLAVAFATEGLRAVVAAAATAATPVHDDPVVAMQFPVDIRQVRTRVLNPRAFDNPKRAVIRETLRAQGVTHLWPITRRPGDDYYITFAGGDTRTELLQELCAETGDPRFCRPTLFFRPWSEGMSEATILGGAITENLTKGDMCLFETAAAYLKLKALIERELREQGELAKERALAASRFVALMTERGIPCSSPSLSRYTFLMTYFDGLAEPLKPVLTNEFIKEAQPRFTRYVRLLKAAGEEDADGILRAAVAAYGEASFSAGGFFDWMGAQLAEVTGRSPSAIEAALERLNDRSVDLDTLFATEAPPPPSAEVSGGEGGVEAAEESREWEEGEGEPTSSVPLAPDTGRSAVQPAPPSAADTARALAEIRERVMAFAEAAGVDLAVRVLSDDPLAFGFYMELIPLEEDRQRIAWWMLATHSLQTQERVIAQLIPATAHWHKAATADPARRDLSLIDSTVGSPTAQNLIHLPGRYVLGPGLPIEARTRWLALVQRLHAFHCDHPQRFHWQLLDLLPTEGRR
ncbi:hypothetical protein [Endothiovibrio diazotrophicus]